MTDAVGSLLPVLGSWSGRAACRNSDPDIFQGRERHQLAKWVCDSLCPVKAECLAQAVEIAKTFEQAQTWGGQLFPRYRAPKLEDRAAFLILHACPECGREIGIKGRCLVGHRTKRRGGEPCKGSHLRVATFLTETQARIMNMVKAGASRAELRKSKKPVDSLRRDGLLIPNQHGSFDITPEGEQALKDYETPTNEEK